MTPREEMLLQLLEEVRLGPPSFPNTFETTGQEIHLKTASDLAKEVEEWKAKAEEIEVQAKKWAKSAAELHEENQRLKAIVEEGPDSRWRDIAQAAYEVEREACLRIAEHHLQAPHEANDGNCSRCWNNSAKTIAEDIRARGKP